MNAVSYCSEITLFNSPFRPGPLSTFLQILNPYSSRASGINSTLGSLYRIPWYVNSWIHSHLLRSRSYTFYVRPHFPSTCGSLDNNVFFILGFGRIIGGGKASSIAFIPNKNVHLNEDFSSFLPESLIPSTTNLAASLPPLRCHHNPN